MAERSDEEIRETAERVMRELDLHEAEAKARGERFERIDEQTLLRKLAGDEADSPFLTGMSWPNLPPGGAGTVRVDIQNPDPFIYAWVVTFVYMFFGPANIIQSIDLSLAAPVDTRLPHYSQPVTLPANGSGTATFPVAVPPNITRGAYVGNVYLVQSGAFGSGQVYDRASFGLVVT
jgi:hypothetical protein